MGKNVPQKFFPTAPLRLLFLFVVQPPSLLRRKRKKAPHSRSPVEEDEDRGRRESLSSNGVTKGRVPFAVGAGVLSKGARARGRDAQTSERQRPERKWVASHQGDRGGGLSSIGMSTLLPWSESVSAFASSRCSSAPYS